MHGAFPKIQFKTTQQRLRENSLTTLGGESSMNELQRDPSDLDESEIYHQHKLQLSDFEGLAPNAGNSFEFLSNVKTTMTGC